MRLDNEFVNLRSFIFALLVIALFRYFFLGQEYLPHIHKLPSLALCYELKRLNVLSTVDHMCEIVVIVIIDDFLLPALALHSKVDAYEAALVHKALFIDTLLVQLIIQCWGFLARCRIDEASVNEFEEGIEQLGRVSLDVQVEQRVIVVKFVELHSQLVHIQVPLGPVLILSLLKESLTKS